MSLSTRQRHLLLQQRLSCHLQNHEEKSMLRRTRTTTKTVITLTWLSPVVHVYSICQPSMRLILHTTKTSSSSHSSKNATAAMAVNSLPISSDDFPIYPLPS